MNSKPPSKNQSSKSEYYNKPFVFYQFKFCQENQLVKQRVNQLTYIYKSKKLKSWLYSKKEKKKNSSTINWSPKEKLKKNIKVTMTMLTLVISEKWVLRSKKHSIKLKNSQSAKRNSQESNA